MRCWRRFGTRVPTPERVLGAAPLGILGGFTVAPVLSLAGLGGMIFPSWTPLHTVAAALIIIGITWPLLALVAAHYRREAVTVVANRPSGGESSSPGSGFAAHLRSLRLARRLSIPAFVERLARAGYVISVEVYSDVEAGEALPECGKVFLAAVAASCKLRRKERIALARVLGRQILVEQFGEDFVVTWFPEPSEHVWIR